MEHQTLEQSLRSGALDQRLAAVYGAEGLAAAKERLQMQERVIPFELGCHNRTE